MWLLKINTKPPWDSKTSIQFFFVEDKSSYLLFHFSMAPMEESQIIEPIPLENWSLLEKNSF